MPTHSSREENEGASSPRHGLITSSANPYPMGRVRTGCLVCRARKVKCDEQRPSCRKCIRLKKTCVYRTPGWHKPLSAPIITNLEPSNYGGDQSSTRTSPHVTPPQTDSQDYVNPVPPPAIEISSDSSAAEALRISSAVVHPDQSLPAPVDNVSPPNHNIVGTLCQGDMLSSPSSSEDRFKDTSTHIYLTLAMDWLGPPELPTQSSFSYFVTEVDCPLLSAFDCLNWRRLKTYITQLGIRETSVATSITALQALYRAQVDRLPMTHAMSVHQAAVASFESILVDDSVDFQIVLAVAFLLCLCVVTLPNEDGPTLGLLSGAFETRLEAWFLHGHPSSVALRIGSWLQLLHTAMKRVGSSGLLPSAVYSLLNAHITNVPGLSDLDCDTHPENGLYDTISDPIFTFYHKLQNISNQVADVSHYRRSRITPEDQAEVTNLLADLKTKMRLLWETRPSTLRLQPTRLQEHFHRTIADPLMSLAGVCLAAYFTETVVIGRTLGDPPFASPEAVEALKRIREIVEADWNTSNGLAINTGYMRPLFLYAIESLQEDETEWAVGCLKSINNPKSRSGFFACVAEALAKAQRRKGRRVTTKAFCYQTFGVPLPFM